MKTGMIVIAALVVGLAVWGTVAYPSGTWRYKMTVTVETPEGLKTGSAVREVTIQTGAGILAESQPRITLKGEAVVVDLGERGLLFALLKGYYLGADYGSDLPFYVFRQEGVAGFSREGIARLERLRTPPQELEPKWYPVMVRFKDPNDPKTVENLLEVKPCEGQSAANSRDKQYCIFKDGFEGAFGEGVHLKSVTVEMTNEEVTRDIKGRLVWLPLYYNRMLDVQRHNSINAVDKLANSLSSGAFLAGEKK